ncbi:MAG: cytochrome c3 family protein [Acidobacteriota bacterium]
MRRGGPVLATIFPPWTNRLPLLAAAAALVLSAGGVFGYLYFFSNEYTDVGYMPRQPVPFSHKRHVGEAKIDCRYCHAGVEVSPVAVVPPTRTCMNCHSFIARDSEKLAAIRESAEALRPMQWIRVHRLPGFAYFDHSAHLRAGVGCVSCHGDVSRMEEIVQVKPLSMGWCMDCHHHPQAHLRPPELITSPAPLTSEQHAVMRMVAKSRRIEPPTDCTGCHR